MQRLGDQSDTARSAARERLPNLATGLVLVLAGLLDAGHVQAERLLARTDLDQDGNFVAQWVDVSRGPDSVLLGGPVTVNAALPAGATVGRVLLANGGQHVVYGAFTSDAASLDDLFVVPVAAPGTATVLNGPRTIGVESPLLFAAVTGSSRVAYSLRNLNTGTDRLFVADVSAPGNSVLINDGLPAGATIADMEMSPDGTALAYRVQSPPAAPQIWISFLTGPVNAQRADAPAPATNYEPNEFQFSPDSRRFLWRGKRGLPGQAEPMRMVTLDPGRRTVSAPVQLNSALVANEQVFEFEVAEDSQRVYYRAIAADSALPGNTYVVALDSPGNPVQLNPAPVSGAGFTAQEDVLVLGDRVLYNSAQNQSDLVELFSVPGDGSGASSLLSGAMPLASSSTSASQPGISHMVASRDQQQVAVIDGDPARELFVVALNDTSRFSQPFVLFADESIEATTQTNLTRSDPFSFSPNSELIALAIDRIVDEGNGPTLVSAGLFVALPEVTNTAQQVFPGTRQTVAAFSWMADRTAVAAAVLPVSRSAQVGGTVAAFVSMINGGAVAGQNCRITLASDLPVAFDFQRTNPTTNAIIGQPNTPVDIAPGAVQTFVVSAGILAEFAPADARFRFACDNTNPVPVFSGLNTLLLSGSATPVPDVVALAATAGNTGRLDLAGSSGNAAFSVATVNVGSAATITAEADTSGTVLPVAVSLCETDAAGSCINPSQATTDLVTTSMAAGATRTFSVFVGGAGQVGDNAVTNRIRVRFRDSAGIVRGQTSVAVRTLN